MSGTPESRYVEVATRLALGIQPMDSVQRSRISGPLYCVRDEAAIDDDARARLVAAGRDITDLLRRSEWGGSRDPLERLHRSPTGRYLLLYTRELVRALATQPPDSPGAARYVDLRFLEGPIRTAPRRYVPRRLRFRLRDPEPADAAAPEFRLRRPRLYPGAGYELSESATALRGRATRGGAPLPWTRVEARVGGTLVGRAHGDDRGEFLLVVEPRVVIDEVHTLTVEVKVTGPDPAVAVIPAASALVRESDPLRDLPLERPALATGDDAILLGTVDPPNYLKSVSRDVALALGRVTSVRDPFVIPS